MAIQVFIMRRFEPGQMANQVIPYVLKMRALATVQPGYISGETLSNVEQPQECMVISRWESLDDWNRWRHSKERAEIQDKIDELSGEKTEYKIFAPMVAR
ncbi:MAG: antibiotic biosynthesis monooxygenase [Deltaproteobacteria bacterium]|nr:antibiotic biosynthesis monooxygenase [Deltaproteobacteria bacterium]